MEVEQECTTPKNQDYQIPKPVVCPPAPRKKMERQQTKQNPPKNVRLFGVFAALLLPEFAFCMTRHYKFNIVQHNVTRLCHTKSIFSVNGRFPGPRIVAREGDQLLVKVVNHVSNNITIHWHGIRQLRSGWADGPAYVTQCPIQTNQSYTYNFTITGQRGTLFWHAHISWLRATVYGPIIIRPKRNESYPFRKPYEEVPIIFGEWWNADPEAVINQALQTGGGPNVSDAYTINGFPGPLYNCSSKDTFKLKVKAGKTYMLRLINAAMNDELFFSIANHTVTIVEADAVYIKPFQTDVVMITPGQTTNVLLNTKPYYPNATFLMAARPYFTGQGTFDNSTVAGILEYEHQLNHTSSTKKIVFKPTLPPINATTFVANFTGKFRSLNNPNLTASVPQTVDRLFYFTVGLGSSPCPKNTTCQGPNGTKFAASVNNTNQTYTYNFTVTGQRGTLFWHAHISWMRATIYGPIIIRPKRNESYPFKKPYKEVPIIFGEWWNADPEAVINQALQTGGAPNVSDAYTINGFPGPLYNCSKDTFKLKVKPGKTYMLRIINAAMNDELFFSIANHTVTIVEADAVYTKPFQTDVVLITPGQTTNVLLKTKPYYPNATFLMTARPYFTGQGTFDNSTVAGILEYEHPLNHTSYTKKMVFKPTLPPINATTFVANFTRKFRSLNNPNLTASVPQTVDRRFYFIVGLGSSPCPKNTTCQGPNGTKFAASVNNVSFALPTTALLQAHFTKKSNGVYTTDFPTNPPKQFNYTGTPPNNTVVSNATRLVVLPFNTSVELVLQDTSILGAESHPLHLHGFNFFVVGQGFGNYNPNKDTANFNLVDPVERNTFGVPAGGWVAIRFLADNPGVWFMHCHFDVHTSWGLRMAWIVMDGPLPNQKLPPPPSDLPKC
ncbi:unnamed protein product [Fraxinus pennsylvanica]|uniref:Laccase n=1 Tax=Fraxinus pennsylvanica TaxID=56036 RepID=A0AAD2A0I1_9LAMI|nr:unnamed protein product [Fraxinus pennsylvanica]